MKSFYSLVTICTIFLKINCEVLVPVRHIKVKYAENSKNEDSGRENKYNLSDERINELNFCKNEDYKQKFISNDNKTNMIWVTWNRTEAGERAVLSNICSIDNGLPLSRRCLHYMATATWENYNNQTVLIDCRISMYCKPAAFDHYVVHDNGELRKHKNFWKQAKIGDYSGLQDICLQPNGLHLTRKCYYDKKHQRAQWSSVDHLKDIKCLQHIRQHSVSRELNILHQSFLERSTVTRRQTTTNLLSLLKKPNIKLLPADVKLTTDILKEIVSDCSDVEFSGDVSKIASNIMSTDTVVLRMSAEVNATNTLLENFENYMDGLSSKLVPNSNCHLTLELIQNVSRTTADKENDTSIYILNLSNIGVYAHIARNISVFFMNPSCALISGIAIYESYQLQTHRPEHLQRENQIHYDSLNDLYYRFIRMNESIDDLMLEAHLELASYIPIDTWRALQKNLRISFLDQSIVVFKIYAHDGLFVEQSLFRSRKPFSKILSVSLPGYEDKLPRSVPFILRHKGSMNSLEVSQNTGCGYWNYSTWTTTGVYTNSSQFFSASDIVLCYTDHLTQFSYLVGGSYRQNDLSDAILVTAVHQHALDIISLIGCSLSLFGLLGIWVTALLFKNWRTQSSNKVLLNMCAALTLQIVLFLFVNTDNISEVLVEDHNYIKCTILGALLQYSLLVLFTWMLIIACLQFQRYVTVIGVQRPKHYIIKAALIAWIFPLLPTLLVALLDSKSYIPNSFQLATDSGICYPSGYGLHFGVILPVALIVLANLFIFLYVFYSISHSLSATMQRHEKQMIVKQIRLSILLFFLLGLSWVFGIFAFMKAGIVFSYLFCLTASLQGFVLFIYFVIMDEKARNSWQKLVRPSCVKKSHAQNNTELQSMTTASTALTHDLNSSRDK